MKDCKPVPHLVGWVLFFIDKLLLINFRDGINSLPSKNN